MCDDDGVNVIGDDVDGNEIPGLALCTAVCRVLRVLASQEHPHIETNPV